ncbi:MAG TPA: electron transfer flavoprotein subunit alpha/FixB family protein [Candidatus Nitrosopolaris sp.]|nr:electron transfer flavoprotein subunit alpha/FixB family protein [Candidatus Nitrosopolaris sp.]
MATTTTLPEPRKTLLRSENSDNRPNERDGSYRHLYVIVEHDDGKPIPVTLEMLGEARRLMDIFNARYFSTEKVVAVVLGINIKKLCEELIFFGADAVICVENPNLRYPINLIDTKVICQVARDKACALKVSPEYGEEFKKPRYMFFSADNSGRHLSATVLAELESGLASDINKLVIEDLEIKHEHKTKGQPERYEKTLEMYRPDFSGFLWTTILCLDNRNPAIQREYHPQACSIIPGVFSPLERDPNRVGIVVDFTPELDPADTSVKVLHRQVTKSPVDFDSHKAIVSFGRGIKDSPEDNIKLIVRLANELNAEIGVSLPISKKPYSVREPISSLYMTSDRVVGTSGRKVAPALYIALGVSGAMQHLAGMKESGFVIAINADPNSPIKDECDIFIRGRIEEVVPALIEELEKQKRVMEVHK